ncbi:MAG: 2-amino-4-hydroxy-6-hydroxymethyldihydropteridine diphosphokinase, partial [Candidatus Cloacimonetes bacterium]|nr:2-amino-4-hydroxy-6-hydroxymethyldihydropteridine diphosphokinase [Candidatus Cloacimonadota bacterium]
NQVLELESTLEPQAMMAALLNIEKQMGRKRVQKWGPRIIDLDILLIQDKIIETQTLTVPHYDLHNRAFALELLSEIAPDAVHPRLNKTISELKQEPQLSRRKHMKPLAAIVLAAGRGTRMKSERAKVTFPLADKAMVQRVVDTALDLDCAKIAVVVGWKKATVIGALEDDGRLSFVEQTEQLGTGHAVQMAAPALKDFSGDVLILCGDVPLLSSDTVQKLYAKHQSSKAAVTVLTAILEDAGKYGRMLRDESGRIKGIVEYKDASPQQRKIQEWNTGIYCYQVDKLFKALARINADNEQNEYYLTDTLSILYDEGEKVENVILEDLMEVSGVNSQEQLAELEDIYVDKIRKKWLNSGVMMHNPATIYIGDDVVLSADVEIGQGCVLKGNTTLDEGVVLGPNCYLENAVISNDSVLLGHNIIVDSFIKEHEILDYGSRVIEEEDYD